MADGTHALYASSKTTAAERRAGYCRVGHALAEPGGTSRLVRSGNYYLCPDCLAVYRVAHPPRTQWLERPCGKNLHTIPAGVRRCAECTKARQNSPNPGPGNVTGGAAYLRTPLPPAQVRANAACSPATAHLFDPAENSNGLGLARAATPRVREAAAICADCPVAAECRDYGTRYGCSGVYGGVYLIKGRPAAYRNARPTLVQIAQDVQDSPAC
jgi:hypothetical protein